MPLTADETKLKNLLKAAAVEALEEQPDLVSDAVAEAVEDIGLARAIRESARTETVDRAEVFSVLRKNR
jgi:hypothetical protein